MEAALKSVLAWWDDNGVDVPTISPARARPRTRTSTGTPTGIRTGTGEPNRRAAQPNARPASQSHAPQPPAHQSKGEAPPAEQAELVAAAAALASGAKTLAQLQTNIESFHAGALSDRARRAVFARGNPQADIMVIGEAPGVNEDAAGKPFVGPAGELLDKILASIGLNEDSVYITNVVNWRPPNNHRPTEADIAICLPLILRHIALAQPKIIVLMGAAAMTALTDFKGITKCRGEWAEINPDSEPKAGDAKTSAPKAGAAIPALISYHPAYLLRQPHLKRDVWRDMLALRAKAAELG